MAEAPAHVRSSPAADAVTDAPAPGGAGPEGADGHADDHPAPDGATGTLDNGVRVHATHPLPDRAAGTLDNGVTVHAAHNAVRATASDAPSAHGGADGIVDGDTSQPQPASSPERSRARGRGRRPSRLLDLRGELPVAARWCLAALGLAGVLALWVWAAGLETESVLVPTPGETYDALREQWREGNLWTDFRSSGSRILYGYLISMAIGIVLGILIGSVRSVEAALEAPIGFMRYVPATALTPLLLLWLGIDEAPKVTLVVVGTVFFNILMVADVARAVPRELIEVSYTLGAGRLTVLRRVVLRHSWPGIVDVARINLAAGWLMLAAAELLAAQDGLAHRIDLAKRFRDVDTMFALLLVFGAIGVASDLVLRWLRNTSSRWARP